MGIYLVFCLNKSEVLPKEGKKKKKSRVLRFSLYVQSMNTQSLVQ